MAFATGGKRNKSGWKVIRGRRRIGEILYEHKLTLVILGITLLSAAISAYLYMAGPPAVLRYKTAGIAAIRSGDFAAAAESLQKADKLCYKRRPDILYPLGMICFADSKYGEAVAIFEDIIKLYGGELAYRGAPAGESAAVRSGGGLWPVEKPAVGRDAYLSEATLENVCRYLAEAHAYMGAASAAYDAAYYGYSRTGDDALYAMAQILDLQPPASLTVSGVYNGQFMFRFEPVPDGVRTFYTYDGDGPVAGDPGAAEYAGGIEIGFGDHRVTAVNVNRYGLASEEIVYAFNVFDAAGNLNGNVVNGAFAVARGGETFFFNGAGIFKEEAGGAQSAPRVKKLVEGARISCLNLLGEWLYFVRQDGAANGIYRVRVDGTGLARLSGEAAGFLQVAGSRLYFATRGGLCSMPAEGGETATLVEGYVLCVNYENGKLYFIMETDEDGVDGAGPVYGYDINTNELERLVTGPASFLQAYDGRLYYAPAIQNPGAAADPFAAQYQNAVLARVTTLDGIIVDQISRPETAIDNYPDGDVPAPGDYFGAPGAHNGFLIDGGSIYYYNVYERRLRSLDIEGAGGGGGGSGRRAASREIAAIGRLDGINIASDYIYGYYPDGHTGYAYFRTPVDAEAADAAADVRAIGTAEAAGDGDDGNDGDAAEAPEIGEGAGASPVSGGLNRHLRHISGIGDNRAVQRYGNKLYLIERDVAGRQDIYSVDTTVDVNEPVTVNIYAGGPERAAGSTPPAGGASGGESGRQPAESGTDGDPGTGAASGAATNAGDGTGGEPEAGGETGANEGSGAGGETGTGTSVGESAEPGADGDAAAGLANGAAEPDSGATGAESGAADEESGTSGRDGGVNGSPNNAPASGAGGGAPVGRLILSGVPKDEQIVYICDRFIVTSDYFDARIYELPAGSESGAFVYGSRQAPGQAGADGAGGLEGAAPGDAGGVNGEDQADETLSTPSSGESSDIEAAEAGAAGAAAGEADAAGAGAAGAETESENGAGSADTAGSAEGIGSDSAVNGVKPMALADNGLHIWHGLSQIRQYDGRLYFASQAGFFSADPDFMTAAFICGDGPEIGEPFIISGGKAFFTRGVVSGESGLYMLDLADGAQKRLFGGETAGFDVTGDTVYYTDASDGTIYMLNINSDEPADRFFADSIFACDLLFCREGGGLVARSPVNGYRLFALERNSPDIRRLTDTGAGDPAYYRDFLYYNDWDNPGGIVRLDASRAAAASAAAATAASATAASAAATASAP